VTAVYHQTTVYASDGECDIIVLHWLWLRKTGHSS